LFKRAIVVLTVVILAALVGGTSTGRRGVDSLVSGTERGVLRLLGITPSRKWIESRRQAERLRAVQRTRAALRKVDQRASPTFRRFLAVCGLAPQQAVIRWGNYYQTIVLSAGVFEPDDQGRSYRLRPNTRSVWVQEVVPKVETVGLFFLSLVPDTPEARRAAIEAGGIIVPGSEQTTNSWGCRSPEPRCEDSVLRGLVLGDSFMQGYFIGDEVTPSMALQRELHNQLHVPVSILNTGHLGYSPEQYYHTLLEYFPRFRPHFVVLSLCANDFGDGHAVFEDGEGDWPEGKYWLDTIRSFCDGQGVPCLVCPVPAEDQIESKRHEGNYPGQISNIDRGRSLLYLDPIDDFVNEYLRLTYQGLRAGWRYRTNPLFNAHLADGHFSPQGAEVWGRVVGRRVALILTTWSAFRPSPFAGPAFPGADTAPPRRRESAGGDE
jgi:hypothetical protein